MDCPQCAVEMIQLEGDDGSMIRCPDCAGLWLDIAEVNRLLLRHNMPGLESLGGHANVDESVGQCPECQVDLVAVEGGERRSMHYDTCEVCGGIFLETDSEGESTKEAVAGIVDFYRHFRQAKGTAKGA
jgi:Zn-finger nucleic acid-binding protein